MQSVRTSYTFLHGIGGRQVQLRAFVGEIHEVEKEMTDKVAGVQFVEGRRSKCEGSLIRAVTM